MFDGCLTISELPSGTAPEFGRQRVAEYQNEELSPCEAFECRNRARCKAEMLACSSYRHFVSSRRGSKLREPTTPNKQIFDQIFNEQDED